MTGRASRFSPVAGQHHAILYLILVFLQHLEERVDADLLPWSVPEVIFLFLCQLIIGSKDGEIMSRSFPKELIQPFSHFLTSPAKHGTIVHAQRTVGHHQVFIDTDNLSEAFARRAGSQRRVE